MVKKSFPFFSFPCLLAIVCAFLTASVAVAQQPQTVADHLAAARAAQQGGKTEEALQYYKAVINLEPKNFGAQFNSGLLHVELKDWQAAVKAFKTAVEIKPDDLSANHYLGLAELWGGNRSAAIAAFKRATQLQPNFIQAYVALAQAYQDSGDPENYLAAAREANRVKPNDVAVLDLLGHALRANRKFVEALEPLQRVAAARPDDVDALYILGNTQLMAGTHEDAIKTLNQVLVLDPSHSEARERLRVSLVRKDLLPKLGLIKKYVEEHPRSGEAHSQLGSVYNSLGMYAESEQSNLQAVALEPKNAEFQTRLCVNYAEWGKTKQGIECYEQTLKLKTNHVLYVSLGDLYERDGKLAEAAGSYRKAIELKPTFVFALYNLGSVLVRQGKHEEAIEPLRKLLEVDPKNVYGNHALGLAYMGVGNKTGAMQQYYILQNLNARVAAALLKEIPQ